jgi:hypothetical protein
MKTITSLCLIAFGATMLTSCGGHQTAVQMLNDPKKKQEIFSAIIADKQVLGDLTTEVSKNEPAVETLTENKDLVRLIMVEHRMGGMMERDTALKAIVVNNLVNIAGKDSVVCDQLGHAILHNHTVKTSVLKVIDAGKAAKDKKKKEKKEKKEAKKEAKKEKKDKHKKK